MKWRPNEGTGARGNGTRLARRGAESRPRDFRSSTATCHHELWQLHNCMCRALGDECDTKCGAAGGFISTADKTTCPRWRLLENGLGCHHRRSAPPAAETYLANVLASPLSEISKWSRPRLLRLQERASPRSCERVRTNSQRKALGSPLHGRLIYPRKTDPSQ